MVKKGSYYKSVRQLGNGPDDNSRTTTLPNFTENNFSSKQCAEILANHFSEISQTFEPLSLEALPPNVRQSIREGKEASDKPVLSDVEVYLRLKKAKKPDSYVPGDIPKKSSQNFQHLW